MDNQQDLGPQIKQFAVEHDGEIKAILRKMLDDFLESTVPENYVEKFDAGSREHGPLTEEKLTGTIWMDHLSAEMKDSYWYVAINLFKQSRGQGEGQ